MEGSVDLTSLQSGKGHALASQVRMPILTSCPQRIQAQFQRLAARQTDKNDFAFEAGLGQISGPNLNWSLSSSNMGSCKSTFKMTRSNLVSGGSNFGRKR